MSGETEFACVPCGETFDVDDVDEIAEKDVETPKDAEAAFLNGLYCPDCGTELTVERLE